jgi:hypothetical protein
MSFLSGIQRTACSSTTLLLAGIMGSQGSLTNTCKFEAHFHLRQRMKLYRDVQSISETEISLFLGGFKFPFFSFLSPKKVEILGRMFKQT